MPLVLPWDCVVPGVPASLQGGAPKQRDWKARVGAAAADRWPPGAPPLERPLRLTMAFLHTGQPLDVDNMLKPTLDGLVAVAYVDDAQVEQVVGVRQDLRGALRLDRLSVVLLQAVVESLAGAGPFAYLRLSPLVEFEELLR